MHNGQADYWWLRSPDLAVYGYDAYYVNSDGSLGDDGRNVTVSYGRRSPDFDVDDGVYCVSQDGVVVSYTWDITRSYGRALRTTVATTMRTSLTRMVSSATSI